MSNSNYYTKGDADEIVTRIGQVHTLTLYCPLEDFCVQSLKDTFDLVLPQYKVEDNLWKGVPTLDALSVFLINASISKQKNEGYNTDILEMIISSLKMFPRLKIINFEFTDDEEIKRSYDLLLQKKKDGIKKYIYNVDRLEFNLSDMFSQRMIDLLNKVMIYNDIIPNSYLERSFILDFTYDNYVSFISMFVNNNREDIDKADSKICEYLSTFPKLIREQKPEIRIITNYSDI